MFAFTCRDVSRQCRQVLTTATDNDKIILMLALAILSRRFEHNLRRKYKNAAITVLSLGTGTIDDDPALLWAAQISLHSGNLEALSGRY